MNPEWQEYLQSEGALLENGVIDGFAADHTSDFEQNTRLTALLDMGVIRASGDDAGTFLQAHFCNDVQHIAENEAQLSGYCNPKGRLLAIFHLTKRQDDYFLVVPREVIASILKRLNMFAQMARPAGKEMIGKVSKIAVSLTDESDSLVVFAFESDAHAELFKKATQNEHSAACFPILTEAESATRYLALAPADVAIAVWQELKPNSHRVSAESWRLSDIRTGSPMVFIGTQETFVPQMTNMHLLDGVSFTKGCYPGQEIVARMQYLGTLKRRMERFRAGLCSIQPGTEICTQDGAAAGVVVLASPTGTPESESELLAVMKISALDGQPLFLGAEIDSVKSAPLERLSMPYELAADPQENNQQTS